VTPPKVLGVPIPALTESQRLRAQPQDPLRSTHRGTCPSAHESHDGRLPETEVTLAAIQILESRIASQDARIAALEARREPSTPPGTASVKSANGLRVSAPTWAAIVLALILWATVAIWQLPKLPWADWVR
jgi:hypothetical protein